MTDHPIIPARRELPECQAGDSRVTFSVVINTDNRLEYLKRTLQGLRYSTHPHFEVCVVAGPTPDGTREFLAGLGDGTKVAHCPKRILSMSRNIGIAMAAGDVVCFIDDDAVPEPEWLTDLAEAYRDRDVGGAGGFVYDHTGASFQARYVTANRLGYATDWDAPSPHLNFPFSAHYPHLLGTNCSFRRSALIEIGGFDEEYEYFLDETDVCCRINDAGYRIVQLANAFVHHKYAPSHMRDERKIVRNWYPLIKNRVYFGLRNGRDHHSRQQILEAGMADLRGWERGILAAEQAGDHTPEEVNRFYDEAAKAMEDAQKRADEPAKLLSAATRTEHSASFSPFPAIRPLGERSTICLVTQDYPPGQNGGIARNVAQLAQVLAADGHHVHVLTRARGRSTVDFEDGVWVHRTAIRNHSVPDQSPITPWRIPQHIWNYGQTMLEEVRAIDARRKVDVVYCPIWDCEPLSFLLAEEFPLIVALQTTMRFWLDSQPQRMADNAWMEEFGNPIIAMEELILSRAPMFHANSRAIIADIERKYRLLIDPERVFHSPHGMEDWTKDVAQQQPPTNRNISILFVGRLESRKGIDTLLEAVPDILAEFPDAILDIVGDDTVRRPDGTTYKDEFLMQVQPKAVLDRIRFHGRVDEDRLRAFYRDCDLFVAPSRYESFGLVFLEAMVFGKPVIAGNAGGAPEVVTHGKTGLLAPPGDAVALGAALREIIADKELRQQMGEAARTDYESRFTESVMLRDFLVAFKRLGIRRETPERQVAQAHSASVSISA